MVKVEWREAKRALRSLKAFFLREYILMAKYIEPKSLLDGVTAMNFMYLEVESLRRGFWRLLVFSGRLATTIFFEHIYGRFVKLMV